MIIRVQWRLGVENTGGGQKTWGGTGKCAGVAHPWGSGKFFGKFSVKIRHFGPSKSYANVHLFQTVRYDCSLLQSPTTID